MMTELARRPDIIKQLRQEQQEVMQTYGSDITGRLPMPPLSAERHLGYGIMAKLAAAQPQAC